MTEKAFKILIPLAHETRNLGINSYGINLQSLHILGIQQINKEINQAVNLEKDIFIFYAIPPDLLNTAFELSSIGFNFIECRIQPYLNLADILSVKRILEQAEARIKAERIRISDKVMDKADIGILEYIARTSFICDRYHADPRCSKLVADERMVYWLHDILEDTTNSVVYTLFKDTEICGFIATKGNHLILTALKNGCTGQGLGKIFWAQLLNEWHINNRLIATTSISIQNIPALNLYCRLGFLMRQTEFVYHFWSKAHENITRC